MSTPMRVGRAYGQMCSLAVSLDVIGERWALLIVRDLLVGPQRFTDLTEAMPGLGSAILSQRLRELRAAGIVESGPVPGDGRAHEYRLTELGEGLRPVILQLARWGMNFLGDADGGAVRSSWAILAIEAMITGKRVGHADETYRFEIGDDRFMVRVTGGEPAIERGWDDDDTALTIRSDAATFMRIGSRLVSPLQAMIAGRLHVDGEVEAFDRCAALLGLSVSD